MRKKIFTDEIDFGDFSFCRGNHPHLTIITRHIHPGNSAQNTKGKGLCPQMIT